MAHYLFNFSKKGAAKGITLREQAANLLKVRMWGIGAKTPNRLSLVPEDRVLIGAPEYQFIGHAELGSTTHDWTPGEATQYPGNFGAGVIFSEAEVWDHPVPMQSVLPQLKLKETNPGAHFFSGVIRVTKDDYETVVAAGTGNPVELEDRPKLAQEHRTEPTPSPTPSPPGDGRRPVDVHLLFKTVEKLKTASAYGGSLSEYDTRAEFIDKYIDALGYTEFGDVQRGGSVDSGNFPDYVLRVNGKPAIAIEAKKLGTPLGAKEAGQVVGYCSNLGVRWGAVTDGRQFKLYDAPVLGVPPEDRLVLSINVGDYKDREDFEARICPELELIAKTELESGAGLERRVAQEAAHELLTAADSRTASALRAELDETRHIKLTPSELSELISELLS